MKKYLVKLNQPIFITSITSSPCWKKEYETIYGFLAPYDENDAEKNDYIKETINSYVSYMAAVHMFNTYGTEYSIDEYNQWIDSDGNVLTEKNPLIMEFEEQCREQLGLEYMLYVVDLELPECGMYKSAILCKHIMDKLVSIAESQITELDNIVLLNRPIFLPKNILWQGEQGYCLIYGFLEGGDSGSVDSYLGYLSLVEEAYLNGGITDSGYTVEITDDGCFFMKDGFRRFVCDRVMDDEYERCRQKHHLRTVGKAPLNIQHISKDDLKDGFVLSKVLYESALGSLDVQINPFVQ